MKLYLKTLGKVFISIVLVLLLIVGLCLPIILIRKWGVERYMDFDTGGSIITFLLTILYVIVIATVIITVIIMIGREEEVDKCE